MRTRMLKPPLFLAVLALSACGSDDILPPDDYGTGRVAFTYSVAGVQPDGRFQAKGAKPVGSQSGTWAASVTDSADAVVYGQHEQGAVHGQIVLSIPGGTAATSAIVPDCDDSCAFVSFMMETTIGGVERGYVCELTEGTISVTTMTDTRMRGRFSGTGVCSSPGVEGAPAFSLTDGTFDTPVVPHI